MLVALVLAACGAYQDGPTGTTGGVEVSAQALTVADCPAGSHVVVGTEANDVLVGTNGADCIVGLAGDDVIDGRNGDDFLVGGPGNDELIGGNGNDQLFGEDGDDILHGDNGSDILDGGNGNDIEDGGNGADGIEGGDGNDVILDSRGPDTIDGGAGTDACAASGCEVSLPGACSESSDCPDPASQRCAGGACVYCHADLECDDRFICTGVESCFPTLGCQDGTPPPSGFPLGVSCRAGIGACRASGDYVCDGSGGVACTAVPGTPTPDEDCDAIDDDCDGDYDEGYSTRATTCGVGRCASVGEMSCVVGVETDSCVPGAPQPSDACNGLDDDCDGLADEDATDTDGDGLCDDPAVDACPFHPRVDPGDGDIVRGTVLCHSPDSGTGDADMALASLPVRSVFGEATTDCNGHYEFVVPATTPLTDARVGVSYFFDNTLIGPEGAATRLRVMDDLRAAWGASPFHFGFGQELPATLTTTPEGRRVLELAPMVISTSECEVWRIGHLVVDDFHQVLKASFPGGGWLQFMRRSGVFGTTPYAFHEYVDLAANFLDQYPSRRHREQTLFHESAHVLRDVTDGDAAHWHGDNTAYRYARCHTGAEIMHEPYAFHEGWAGYWERARKIGRCRLVPLGSEPACSSTFTQTRYCDGWAGPNGIMLTTAHMDWVEAMVGDRLLRLAECVGGGDDDLGDRIMAQTLEANPGTIHSLYQFETALCADRSCCGLERPEPPVCPPDFGNDGTSCWLGAYLISEYR